jgi:hypothetical protein
MNADFSSVHNHYERPVFDMVSRMAANFPYLEEESLPDVACVALNRLGARYIRHSVDLAFYLTVKERRGIEQNLYRPASRCGPGAERLASAASPRRHYPHKPVAPSLRVRLRPLLRAGRTSTVGKLTGKVLGKSRL